MTTLLGWYLALSLLGVIAWPIAFRLLPGLPDRGYALARALGLLLVAYLYWILGMLGILHNSTGGIILSILVVGGVGIWIYQGSEDTDEGLINWIQANYRLVFTGEILFLLAFAFWLAVRSYNPDISGTEKPMELAFLNGVRSSPAFPPHDPWLAGYAISYYYFGYVIIGMLADISGVSSSVAFNMASATLFALTLLGSFGLVVNLLAAHRQNETSAPAQTEPAAMLGGLLGALLTGVIGNLEGALELLRSLNLPAIPARFWLWLDIEDLTPLATGEQLWPPDRWRFWWWWRASRVIHDRDPAGVSIGLQPIDEFPFFSFLLGDMHPHVLALPFVLLALALAFNALTQSASLNRRQVGLCAVAFGGLAFLNTWDLPIYFFVLGAALVVRLIREKGIASRAELLNVFLMLAGILVAGVLLYLPWYPGFTSQAGGILPNALFPTRLHQYLVMFGLFVVVIGWYLMDEATRFKSQIGWQAGLAIGGGLLVVLLVMALGLGWITVNVDAGAREFALRSTGLPPAAGTQQEIRMQLLTAFRTIAIHRATHPLTSLLLAAMVGLSLARLLPRQLFLLKREPDEDFRTPYSASTAFVLILILTGAMLTLGSEYLYLRDNFGQRLNTVFKFYYAAWILFAVASAFIIPTLAVRQSLPVRILFAAVVSVLIVAGSTYPALAIPEKTGGFIREASDPPPTLDGIDFIKRNYPGDYAGISWLIENANPPDVILEAVGPAYSYYGRVSSATGLPTVLGWSNHERQWRGEYYAAFAGTREDDIREIYNTPNIERATALLAMYDVKYVFVGSLEQSSEFASPRGLLKFDRFLQVVFRDSGVTIYRFDASQREASP